MRERDRETGRETERDRDKERGYGGNILVSSLVFLP